VIEPVSISFSQVFDARRTLMIFRELWGWKSVAFLAAVFSFLVLSEKGVGGKLGGLVAVLLVVLLGLIGCIRLGRKRIVTTTEITEVGITSSRDGNSSFTSWATLGLAGETPRSFKFRLRAQSIGSVIVFKNDFTPEQLKAFRKLLEQLDLPRA
jgi:hypothetical protein